tara:strand:+ start:322 stop:804 length:483 start_codon:yes stop_codon:yes gene_type:complete
MPLADSDVNDVLQEYVEKHLGFSSDIARHLVLLAEASAIHVASFREIDQTADLNFPEVKALAQIYTHIDPRRKTIFSDRESGQAYDETKFRAFYRWLDKKAETNEYGNGRKIALRDALVGTDAYDRAFPKAVPVAIKDDDDYVDEDRCEADYAEEYVRDA